MVKLSEYVSEVLTEILDGVASAQEYAKEHHTAASINPVLGMGPQSTATHNAQPVEFDILLTANESEAGKAGLGVLGGVLGVGGSIEAGQAQAQTHRVRFSIPVFFPPMR